MPRVFIQKIRVAFFFWPLFRPCLITRKCYKIFADLPLALIHQICRFQSAAGTVFLNRLEQRLQLWRWLYLSHEFAECRIFVWERRNSNFYLKKLCTCYKMRKKIGILTSIWDCEKGSNGTKSGSLQFILFFILLFDRILLDFHRASSFQWFYQSIKPWKKSI